MRNRETQIDQGRPNPHRAHRSGFLRTLILLLATAVVAILALGAQAQPGSQDRGFAPRHGGGPGGGPGGPGFMLRGVDADQDGTITSAEWNAVLTALDADTDGTITREEMHAWAVTRAAEQGITLPENPPEGHRGGFIDRVSEHLDTNGDGALQTSEFQARFDQLDANGDGNLTGDELPQRRFRHRGGHGAHGGMAIKAADSDDDGEVTLAEWNAFVATVDANGDGQVSHEEVRTLAHPDFEPPTVALEEIEGLFDQFDANGDGVVSADELPERRGFRGRGGPGGRGGRGNARFGQGN